MSAASAIGSRPAIAAKAQPAATATALGRIFGMTFPALLSRGDLGEQLVDSRFCSGHEVLIRGDGLSPLLHIHLRHLAALRLPKCEFALSHDQAGLLLREGLPLCRKLLLKQLQTRGLRFD